VGLSAVSCSERDRDLARFVLTLIRHLQADTSRRRDDESLKERKRKAHLLLRPGLFTQGLFGYSRMGEGLRVFLERRHPGGPPEESLAGGNSHPLTHDLMNAIRSGSPAAWADSDMERGISTKSTDESRWAARFAVMIGPLPRLADPDPSPRLGSIHRPSPRCTTLPGQQSP
jgi:hypothetical protein